MKWSDISWKILASTTDWRVTRRDVNNVQQQISVLQKQLEILQGKTFQAALPLY